MSNYLVVFFNNKGKRLNEFFRSSKFMDEVMLAAAFLVEIPEGLSSDIFYSKIVLRLFFSDLHMLS